MSPSLKTALGRPAAASPSPSAARLQRQPRPPAPEPLQPWTWSAEEFAQACEALRRQPETNAHVSRSKYPLHMLRYWLCARLLLSHLRGRQAPRVMEIGIDRGQFHHFSRALPQWVDGTRWHGADVSPATQALCGQGYEAVHLADFTNPLAVSALAGDPAHRGQYDAVVVLHFLEHLPDPEACLSYIRPLLRPGGILLGGMPSCPDFARERRERRIRRTAQPFGHQSVFSVERMAQALHGIGLHQQLLTGAFFARRRDSKLEDSASWLRMNLWFGRRFPRWPGELYFVASDQALDIA